MKTPDEHRDEPLEELPDFLKELRKREGLQVREAYFDTLPDKIMARVDALPQKKAGITRRLLMPSLAVAAMIGLMVFLFWLLKPGSQDPDYTELALVLQDKDAIAAYLIEQGSVDQESIISLLPEDACDDINVMPHDSIFPASDTLTSGREMKQQLVLDSAITSDDILQYLLDEGVEVSPFE